MARYIEMAGEDMRDLMSEPGANDSASSSLPSYLGSTMLSKRKSGNAHEHPHAKAPKVSAPQAPSPIVIDLISDDDEEAPKLPEKGNDTGRGPRNKEVHRKNGDFNGVADSEVGRNLTPYLSFKEEEDGSIYVIDDAVLGSATVGQNRAGVLPNSINTQKNIRHVRKGKEDGAKEIEEERKDEGELVDQKEISGSKNKPSLTVNNSIDVVAEDRAAALGSRPIGAAAGAKVRLSFIPGQEFYPLIVTDTLCSSAPIAGRARSSMTIAMKGLFQWKRWFLIPTIPDVVIALRFLCHLFLHWKMICFLRKRRVPRKAAGPGMLTP